MIVHPLPNMFWKRRNRFCHYLSIYDLPSFDKYVSKRGRFLPLHTDPGSPPVQDVHGESACAGSKSESRVSNSLQEWVRRQMKGIFFLINVDGWEEVLSLWTEPSTSLVPIPSKLGRLTLDLSALSNVVELTVEVSSLTCTISTSVDQLTSRRRVLGKWEQSDWTFHKSWLNREMFLIVHKRRSPVSTIELRSKGDCNGMFTR